MILLPSGSIHSRDVEDITNYWFRDYIALIHCDLMFHLCTVPIKWYFFSQISFNRCFRKFVLNLHSLFQTKLVLEDSSAVLTDFDRWQVIPSNYGMAFDVSTHNTIIFCISNNRRLIFQTEKDTHWSLFQLR